MQRVGCTNYDPCECGHDRQEHYDRTAPPPRRNGKCAKCGCGKFDPLKETRESRDSRPSR